MLPVKAISCGCNATLPVGRKKSVSTPVGTSLTDVTP